MKTKDKLIKEFENVTAIPLLEIEINGEYHVYHIEADSEGIHAGGCGNSGFHSYGIMIEWDEDESLSYHLQGLYELCYEDALND